MKSSRYTSHCRVATLSAMRSASSASGWRFRMCCFRSLSERCPVPHALHRFSLSCFGTCSRITCLCMLRRLSFRSQNRHCLTLPCFSSSAAAFRLCSFLWQGRRHSLKFNKRRKKLVKHTSIKYTSMED